MMRLHACTVLRTVGRAVAGLNDLETLMPVLHALGKRHARCVLYVYVCMHIVVPSVLVAASAVG
jgi:hypothetical protein